MRIRTNSAMQGHLGVVVAVVSMAILINLFAGCGSTAKHEHLNNMEGKEITVRDTAYNTKSGAVVGKYRLEGLHSWPDEVLGKVIEASGRLKTIEHLEEDLYTPDGLVKQGMVGTEYILLKPTWRLAE